MREQKVHMIGTLLTKMSLYTGRNGSEKVNGNTQDLRRTDSRLTRYVEKK